MHLLSRRLLVGRRAQRVIADGSPPGWKEAPGEPEAGRLLARTDQTGRAEANSSLPQSGGSNAEVHTASQHLRPFS